MRKLLIVLAVLILAMLVLAGSALAFPNMSPDGATCTPCHTDGRTGAVKPAPSQPAPSQPTPSQPAASQPAAKPATIEAKPATGTVTKQAEAKPAVAAPAKTSSSAVIKVKVTVPGKEQTVDAVKRGNQTLLPARAVVEAMSGQVLAWDNKAKTMTIAYGSKTATIKAASILKGNIAYLTPEELTGVLGGSFDNKTNVLKKGKSDVIREQWSTTKHNIATLGELTADSPSKRDSCVSCHDGVAFANQKSKRAELPNPEAPVGQDCNTCHGDRGKAIRSSGNVSLPAVKVAGAGEGALCMTCHNGRKVPTPDAAKLNAPHGAAKADVLTASGGWEVAGVVYPSSPHLANPDSCVSCHMAKNEGVANHTFKIIDTPEYVKAACGSCHDGLTSFNRIALGDYDGNGAIQGIQDEVKGLVHVVEGALKATLAGGSYAEVHGGFEFHNASGELIKPSEAQYLAAWNTALVEFDASGGIHNPAYVVKLLQESYKQLTGKPVPQANLR